MKTYTVNKILKKPIFNEYFYIEGYCYLIKPARYVMVGKHKTKTSSFIVISDNKNLDPKNIKNITAKDFIAKNILNISFRPNDINIIEKFFKKLRIKKGRVKLLGILFQWRNRSRLMPLGINNILKIELLDEKGNTIAEMKVGKSSIPKGLRRKT